MDELEQKWNIKEWNKGIGKVTGFLLSIYETEFVLGDELLSGFYLYFFVENLRNLIKVPLYCKAYLLIEYDTYFCGVRITEGFNYILLNTLENELGKLVQSINVLEVEKINASSVEHISAKKGKRYNTKTLIRIEVNTEREYTTLVRYINRTIKNNKSYKVELERYQNQEGSTLDKTVHESITANPLLLISAIYEHDIDNITKALIVSKIRLCKWYDIEMINNDELYDHFEFNELTKSFSQFFPRIILNESLSTILPSLQLLAWDIECYKEPFRFPNADKDPIMSISYKTNNAVFLLINTNYYGNTIHDFNFDVENECCVYSFSSEENLLRFFLDHVREVCKPQIVLTYNGDVFDFPYLRDRCSVNNISLRNEWGVIEINTLGPNAPIVKKSIHFLSSVFVHIDCIKWVERDSYLPLGSRSLKSTARIKLKREPREVDPEVMVQYCVLKPQVMAEYNVSDSILTYELYKKYIHTFLLALCTIIPLQMDWVSRKGTGTLCECLLMAEAFARNVLILNKTLTYQEQWYDDEHLLLTNTYTGGYVEQIRSGIYNSSIEETFNIDSNIIDILIDNLDIAYNSFISNEVKIDGEIESTNWTEIKEQIISRLTTLKNLKSYKIKPLIYHLDVGAMYPNIILTNRLQPQAIVEDEDCIKCEYGHAQHECRLYKDWTRKINLLNLDKSTIKIIENQLDVELFEQDENNSYKVSGPSSTSDKLSFRSLSMRNQYEIKMNRLKNASAKLNKHKVKIPKTETCEASICMRNIDFYVSTVLNFRNRRIVFKNLQKQTEQKLKTCPVELRSQIQDEIIYYNSLQLAHKVILNSFYGYVMRVGARWYSLEMAAIVTKTGANIIEVAKKVCTGVGFPLELDTDGIWTLLPCNFPCNFSLNIIYSKPKPNDDIEDIAASAMLEKKVNFNYICWMLNGLIEEQFSNKQYLVWENGRYKKTVHNTIFFELDGPYKAMFLPASEKVNTQLKKRYIVYDYNDNIVELKGFEMKRRGELGLVKTFQEELFAHYSIGTSKEEIYANLARIAENWIRFIKNRAKNINDDYIILHLLRQSTTLSKSVTEKKNAKSLGITAAKKLAEIFNDQLYIQESNITTSYLLSAYPLHESKTSRAIPLSLFDLTIEKQLSFFNKWSNNSFSLTNIMQTKSDNTKRCATSIRNIVDWEYYLERLCVQIQKLIVVPCVLQNIENPCSVIAPAWLLNKKSCISNTLDVEKYQFFNKKVSNNLPVIVHNNQGNLQKSDANNIEEEKMDINCIIKKFCNLQNCQPYQRICWPPLRLKKSESVIISNYTIQYAITPDLDEIVQSLDFILFGIDSLNRALLFNWKLNFLISVFIEPKIYIVSKSEYNENKVLSKLLINKDRYMNITTDQMYLEGMYHNVWKLIVEKSNINTESLNRRDFLKTTNEDHQIYVVDEVPPNSVSIQMSKNMDSYYLTKSLNFQATIPAAVSLAVMLFVDFIIHSKSVELYISINLDNILDVTYIKISYMIFSGSTEMAMHIMNEFTNYIRVKYKEINNSFHNMQIINLSSNIRNNISLSKFIMSYLPNIYNNIALQNKGSLVIYKVFTNTSSLKELCLKLVIKKSQKKTGVYPFFDVNSIPFNIVENQLLNNQTIKILYSHISPYMKLQSNINTNNIHKVINDYIFVDRMENKHICKMLADFKIKNGYFDQLDIKTKVMNPASYGGLDINKEVLYDFYFEGIVRDQMLKINFNQHIYITVIKLSKHLTKGYQLKTISIDKKIAQLGNNNLDNDNNYYHDQIDYFLKTVSFLSEMVTTENQAVILEELIENAANTDILEEIRVILLPIFINQLKNFVNLITTKLDIQCELVYISSTSFIITVPTFELTKAKQAAPIIYQLLNNVFQKTDVFSSTIEHIKTALIFNSFNRIFVNNNDEIVDFSLTMLNCLTNASILEKVVLYYLIESYKHKNHINKFIEEQFYHYIVYEHKLLHKHFMRANEIPIYENKRTIIIPSLIIYSLLKFDQYDYADNPKYAAQLHLLDSIPEMLDYNFVPVIILKTVKCENCNLILDLYIQDNDNECPNCATKYPFHIIENKLLHLIDTYILYEQKNYINYCNKCNKSSDMECQRYCECGTEYIVSKSNEVCLLSFLKIIYQYSKLNNWIIIELKLDQYLKLI